MATFPVIRDTEGKIFTLFKSEAVPANLLIDRKGKIVYSKDAGTDLEALEASIDTAVKEPVVAPTTGKKPPSKSPSKSKSKSKRGG
jgi:hypothetical protein